MEIDNGRDPSEPRRFSDLPRMKKAWKLYLVVNLPMPPITVAEVKAFTADQWKLMELAAGVTPASDETKALLIDMMTAALEISSRRVNLTAARQLIGSIENRQKPNRMRKPRKKR